MLVLSLVILFPIIGTFAKNTYEVDCNKLRMGQFLCPDPAVIETYIDPKTQQPQGCTRQNKAEGVFVLNYL